MPVYSSALPIVHTLPREMGKTVCPASWQVKANFPAFNRFKYIYGGEAFFTCRGKRIALQEKHIYIFPAHCEYVLSHNPAKPLSCLWFHLVINPSLISECIKCSINSKSILHPYIRILENLVYQKTGPVDIFDNIFQNIIHHVGKLTTVSCITDRRIADAMKNMHTRYREDISPAVYAEQSGISMPHFIRLFKKNIGLAPLQYLLLYRVEMSKTMLAAGASVKETAFSTGFNDEKFFSRIFRKNTGINPLAYKKSIIMP
ncbi:MAG: hypothetical protein A2096_06165 [Spirochaetes bacterium GWF1_41_5]|nr:MAG: hypothetical protein A2096_06165 [Spirochaetes bacterium GWF1_41_5]